MDLKVTSQTGVILETTGVNSLLVPTLEGLIEVLAQHENLISALDIGIIEVTYKSGTKTELVVAGGFMQIVNNQVRLLVDYGDMAEHLVKSEVEKALRLAQEKVANPNLPPAELIQLEKRLRYERFRAQVAGL